MRVVPSLDELEDRHLRFGLGAKAPPIEPLALDGCPGLVSGIRTAVTVAPGFGYTSALLGDGSALCWGLNLYGMLGRGAFSYVELTPGPVTGGYVFRTLRSGDSHTCGLEADGHGWCWGVYRYGQLGTATVSTGPWGIASPVAVLGGPWASLVAGGWSTCGVLSDGTGQCWGFNNIGQTGTGSTSLVVATPTTISGGLVFPTP